MGTVTGPSSDDPETAPPVVVIPKDIYQQLYNYQIRDPLYNPIGDQFASSKPIFHVTDTSFKIENRSSLPLHY